MRRLGGTARCPVGRKSKSIRTFSLCVLQAASLGSITYNFFGLRSIQRRGLKIYRALLHTFVRPS